MQDIVNQMISNQSTNDSNDENWNELGTLFAQINNNLVLRLIINGLKTQFMNRREEPPGVKMELNQNKSMQILEQLAMNLEQRDSKRSADTISDFFQLVIQTIQTALKATEMQFRSTVNE